MAVTGRRLSADTAEAAMIVERWPQLQTQFDATQREAG